MKKSRLLGAVCTVLFTFVTISANAALVGRLPATPGGTDYQVAYDDVLDITWATDAALSGLATWNSLIAWANGLEYLGFDDWRLASISVAAGLPSGTTTSVVNCDMATELACRDNELGYMYYQNLGGSFLDELTGNQTVGDVTLMNIQSLHWSGTEIDSVSAWLFSFNGGAQGLNDKHINRYGWAVRSGDVVPVPSGSSAVVCWGSSEWPGGRGNN
jgi:hypothetical protein